MRTVPWLQPDLREAENGNLQLADSPQGGHWPGKQIFPVFTIFAHNAKFL